MKMKRAITAARRLLGSLQAARAGDVREEDIAALVEHTLLDAIERGYSVAGPIGYCKCRELVEDPRVGPLGGAIPHAGGQAAGGQVAAQVKMGTDVDEAAHWQGIAKKAEAEAREAKLAARMETDRANALGDRILQLEAKLDAEKASSQYLRGQRESEMGRCNRLSERLAASENTRAKLQTALELAEEQRNYLSKEVNNLAKEIGPYRVLVGELRSPNALAPFLTTVDKVRAMFNVLRELDPKAEAMTAYAKASQGERATQINEAARDFVNTWFSAVNAVDERRTDR